MVETTVTETKETAWHALTAQECLGRLNSPSERGLSAEEAARRLAEFGPNALTPKKGKPAWLRFLEQFHQPLVYILLVAAIVTLFLHEWVDSSVIFLVVFVNAVVGYLQEAKALKALDALSRSMITHAVVFRNGKKITIPSAELVPGDIVFLASGDKVPADMRLIKSRELQADESALTGESMPVQKSTAEIAPGTVLADRVNMLYASALVTYGQGTALVVETGSRTEVGRISELISTAENLATPLTKKIAQFSQFLLYVILGMAALTFLAGILRGQPAAEMFMAAVALAVGAIPEGLPAAVTITLAIGVSRMAGRRAIIRKLPAVETLGSTMIICSDKTGTLTENQMTVQKLFAGSIEYDLTGNGYAPKGEILAAGKPAVFTGTSAARECLLAGLLCNDGALVEKDGRFEVEGDPTEGALIVSAAKAGFDWSGGNAMPRLDCIPFESQHQYMATAHTGEGPERLIYMKGAVEKVLDRCQIFLDENGEERPFDNKEIVLSQVESMASRGLRVLAFARRKIPSLTRALSHGDLDGMTFLGLQGMMDPPRKEAIRAVQNCHRAGITVKMITGDHVLTAAAIAKQLNLKREPAAGEEELLAVTGKEMEGFTDAQFEDIAARATVFARVTPEQKLRLVKALQARGNVVAMTGDGVNDAPALKQANIGVAMGLGGTEAAKEASDMVLTDDNFATIEAAVEEGRCVFSNLRKFIIWSLPTNLGEGLSILAAILAGTALPILPVQILWINMTTAVCLGMMLAFEPKEADIMSRPPRDPKTPIMTRGIVKRTLYVGLLLVAGVYGLFIYERSRGASLEEARTVASTMLVMGELFYLFNCRSLTKSAFSIGFFSNKLVLAGTAVMLVFQALFIYTPFMNMLFHSAPLNSDSWLRILCASLLIYLVVEAEKHLRKQRGSLGKVA